MRVNKFVARATGMARRKADSLIEGGQIVVNNKPAIIGQQLKESDEVTLAGKALHIPDYKYLLLNKPVGYVCSRQSQRGEKTVYNLLPPSYRHLKLVGRLDKDSSGAILLTDDGDFAHQLMHPGGGKSKLYKVELDRPLKEEDINLIESGVALEDGVSKMRVISHDKSKVELELREGRNRQIRRSFAPLGYEVVKLHRQKFAKFSVSKLGTGKYREVEP